MIRTVQRTVPVAFWETRYSRRRIHLLTLRLSIESFVMGLVEDCPPNSWIAYWAVEVVANSPGQRIRMTACLLLLRRAAPQAVTRQSRGMHVREYSPQVFVLVLLHASIDLGRIINKI